MEQPEAAVTEMLLAWRGGDQEALDHLMPLLYQELKRLAQYRVSREHPSQTWSATDLVHEAFVRLVNVDVSWQDRAHFLAVAARLMRRILINRSRDKARLKRGGDAPRPSVDEMVMNGDEPAIPGPSTDLLELDQALRELAELDEIKAQIIELVYFGGLTYDELAETVGTSRATAHRHLRLAKAWLRVRLSGTDEHLAAAP